MKYIFLVGTLFFSYVNVFAHGWLTAPMTRTEYLNETDKAAVAYEPQGINSSLTGGGSSTYDDIEHFSGGPLGFFKNYHAVQDKQLCANGHTSLPRLLEPLPGDWITNLTYGQDVTFSWTKTAAHVPSNHFTFITTYDNGKFNPTPTWNDFAYVEGCDVAGVDEPTQQYTCKLQLKDKHLHGKQIVLSIWQRVDPAGENFLSCSDVNFK